MNTSHDRLISWGWRVPFIVGALAALIGFYIRHRVAESPEFARLVEEGVGTRIRDIAPQSCYFFYS